MDAGSTGGRSRSLLMRSGFARRSSRFKPRSTLRSVVVKPSLRRPSSRSRSSAHRRIADDNGPSFFPTVRAVALSRGCVSVDGQQGEVVRGG